ncbi:MAG: hypothetical protein AAF988_07120 [Pseudomonadota bacterium]
MSESKTRITLSLPESFSTGSVDVKASEQSPSYGGFSGTAGHKARATIRAASAEVTNTDNPYEAFHRIRAEAREVLPQRDLTTHNAAEQKSGEEGRTSDYILALAVQLPQELTQEQAVSVYDKILNGDTAKIIETLAPSTVIQEILRPSRPNNESDWQIDLIVRSFIDENSAMHMYKRFLESQGQKSGLNLFDPATAHSWAIRNDATEMLKNILHDVEDIDWAVLSKNLVEMRAKMDSVNAKRSLTGSTAHMMRMG